MQHIHIRTLVSCSYIDDTALTIKETDKGSGAVVWDREDY